MTASILTFQAWASYFHSIGYEQWKRQTRRAWGLAYEPATGEAMWIWAVLLATAFAKQFYREAGLARVRHSLDFYRRQGECWSLAFTCARLGELLQEENKADARILLKEALEKFHELGDLAVQEHAYSEAASYLEGSVNAARKAGDLRWLNNFLWDLGLAYLHQGAFEKAFQIFEQTHQDAYASWWTGFEIFALSTFSFDAVRYGDLSEAHEKRRQCMELASMVQDTNRIAWDHFEMGEIEQIEEDLETARRW